MSLYTKIVKVSERATQLGSIEKIESSPIFMNENGVNFMVSVAKSLLNRPFNFVKPSDPNCNNKTIIENNSNTTTTKIQDHNDNATTTTTTTTTTIKKKFIDPFLPCDKDLFVQELYDRHNLVLNKYNVSNHHSIIATKEFENQVNPLNEFDFRAIWKCIKECNMLCFFNCGPNSGASQPHKHVQLLPTPFNEQDEPNLKCPIETLFIQYKTNTPMETIFQIDQLPFKNAAIYYDKSKLLNVDADSDTDYTLSKYFQSKYNSLLNHFDLHNPHSYTGIQHIDINEACKLKSYNFIMTDEWMFIIPRSNYQANGISINSVGFTGAILVRKEEELSIIKSNGILSILKDVSFEK